jgi:radical SAM protein with 4Fe4S-binding SPASM domain
LERLFFDLAAGGTRGVTIEGGGEPTLWPHFVSATKLARAHGLSVGLITNGTHLFPPGRQASFYSNFQWIRLSLDAPNPGLYKKLKGFDGFDLLLDSLPKLAKITPRPVLGVGYVLTALNDDPQDLRQLALKLRDLGADYLHLRPVVDHDEMASQKDPKILLEALLDLETEAFSINAKALTENQVFGNDGLPCLAHSLSTVITADGSVFLCGRLNDDPLTGAMGNIKNGNFKDIWEGQKRREQITLAAQGQYCHDHCPQCRMTKYNRLLHNLKRVKTPDFI